MQTGSKVGIRQQAEARRAAEFEQLQRERLRPANGLIDRFTIELEAAQLIDAHTPKESILPPHEYENNARTALFEALTSSAHLSVVELGGDDPDLVNQQVLERLLNGYSQKKLPLHEQSRRFMEICEELTAQRVQLLIEQGKLPVETELLTDSPFPEEMSTKEAESLGYRAGNKKGMRRTHCFAWQNGQVVRRIEQLAYSNADATSSQAFLTSQGAQVASDFAIDVNVLGTQTLIDRRYFTNGVVDVQRRVDEFNGGSVRFGGQPSVETPSYDTVRELSHYRESRLKDFTQELAAYEEMLDKKVVNGSLQQQASNAKYMLKVRDIVRRICIEDPRYVRDALGEKSVKTYQKAAQLQASGDSTGAADIVAANASNENAIVICGMSISSEDLSPVQVEEMAQALSARHKRQTLRPSHDNDRFYLVQKYGNKDITRGTCIACDRRRFVAACSICPGCDDRDTQRPGYIEDILRRKNKISAFEVISAWVESSFKEKTPRLIGTAATKKAGLRKSAYELAT